MTDQHMLWAAWGGLALLAILCLPISGISKFILESAAIVLRLTLLGVIAAGAYLGFRPAELPTGVSSALGDVPGLLAMLPDTTSPFFGPSAAMCIAVLLLPVLAAIDVTRGLAGRRSRRLRRIADEPPVLVEPARPVVTEPPPLRPVDRRTAAATIASAGTRRRASAS